MRKPSCLIFSHRKDEHLSAVLGRMTIDADPFIIDLRDIGQSVIGGISPSGDCPSFLRLATGEVLYFDEVTTLWWRRPTYIRPVVAIERQYVQFVEAEQTQFMDGLLGALPSNVAFYNHPDVRKRLDRKAFQLQLAKGCGLRIPRTCITSDPIVADEFLRLCPDAIYKSSWGSAEFWQPTRKLDVDVRRHLKTLTLCPVIIQEYVEGVFDYRVTIIDDDIFSVGFDLRQSRYPMDVRIDTQIPCATRSIPREVESALLDFMRRSNLRYGAFDLREDVSGQFVFLEVNPAGQFLYLDILAQTQITECLAATLSRRNAAGLASSQTAIIPCDSPSVTFSDETKPFNSHGTTVTHIH
jgi:glutathione synthase/RimK-type ligase-like ATP-grasp enzyme